MVVGAQFDNARLKCVEIFLITYIGFIHKNNSDYHGIGKMWEKQSKKYSDKYYEYVYGIHLLS